MAELTTHGAPQARRGWVARLFRPLRPQVAEPQRGSARQVAAQVHGLARQLLAEGRYAFVLHKDAADQIPEVEARPAWSALENQMALSPAGVVPVVLASGAVEPVEMPAFFMDRHAVTNRQFHQFVAAGGYEALEGWPRDVWPSVMKFVDRTRQPGPRDWEHGKPPTGREDHPVVGICWHEATAYATWAGKRLPTAAEWQKAGGWPEQLSGGDCTRFPWGDVFEPGRANLATGGPGRTVPVDGYPAGATPNGIMQMTGNVWEWLADRLETIPCRPDETFSTARPMRRIVGGAFDTYFPDEATCQFVTGQPELDRRDNIGFRCALSVARLRPRPSSGA